MRSVSIKEGKDKFPALVREAEAGERVLVTRNGKPVAEIVPLDRERRRGGIDFEALRRYKEERGIPQIMAVVSDDFDDPLPEDFLITPQR